MTEKPFDALDSFDCADEILHKIHPRLVNDVERQRAFVEDALEQLQIAKALLHEAITAEREVKRLLDGDLYRGRAPIAEVYDPLADLGEPVEMPCNFLRISYVPEPEPDPPAPPPDPEPEVGRQDGPEILPHICEPPTMPEPPVETNPEPPEICAPNGTRTKPERPEPPLDWDRNPMADPAQELIDERRPASDGRKVRAVLPELWGNEAIPNEIMAAHINAATNIGINRVYAAIKLLEREGEITIEPRKVPGRAVTNIIRPRIKSEAGCAIAADILDRARKMIADHKTVSMAATLLNVRKRDLFAALYPNRVSVTA